MTEAGGFPLNTKILVATAFVGLLCAPLVLADSGSYTSGAGMQNCANAKTAVGTVCFKVPAGATSVTVTINDAVFGAIGGSYSFNGALGSGAICPGVITIPIPAGARTIVVDASAAGGGPGDACGASPYAATTGTIEADFA